MTTSTRAVVVGADDSPGSAAALDWAADAAARRGMPLRVVSAVPAAMMGAQRRGPVGAPPLGRPPELLQEARQVAEEAAARARSAAPGVEVSVRVHDALDETAALMQEAADAELLVLGSHGRGGFAGLVLGSTSASVATHAPCPVVVVRPRAEPPGPSAGRVVVGIDGSTGSRQAAEFAFAEAALRGVGLTAVHAWTRVFVSARTPQPVLDWDEVAAEEAAVLDEGLAGLPERYPGVDVRRTLAEGHSAGALVEESAGAELLVLSSRGRGGFAGLLLGSVSQAALHHAGCPVAIVRPHVT